MTEPTEPTGQVCATCGAKLVAKKQPPTRSAQALGFVFVASVVVFASGFVWQAIQWSWGL